MALLLTVICCFFPAYGLQRYVFTRNPTELRGDFVTTRLIKSKKGLGFTIIGGDDNNEEFLQIKTIIPHGPAYDDGKLQRSQPSTSTLFLTLFSLHLTSAYLVSPYLTTVTLLELPYRI